MAKKCAPGLLRLLMALRVLRGVGGSIFWGVTPRPAPRAPRPAPLTALAGPTRIPALAGRTKGHGKRLQFPRPPTLPFRPRARMLKGKDARKMCTYTHCRHEGRNYYNPAAPPPPRMLLPGHHCKRRSLGEKLTVTVRARFGRPWLQNDPICTFSYALHTAVL